MVQGIRFRDGTVIDFQDTEWSINVDTASDEVVFEHAASGNTYTYTSTGEFSASTFDFTDDELNVQSLALGTTLITDADSPYTTSGEGVVFVDSSSAPVEVVLASADRRDGVGISVIDVGGAAGTNAITISTEGGETIDGGATSLVEAEYGAKRLASDGSNWFSAGGGSGAGGVPVEDDGSLVLDPAKNINFGNALSVSDDGDDTVTIDGLNKYTDEEAQDAVAGPFLTAGNALNKEYLDNSNELTLEVPTDAIQETELDETITPTWTGQHTFSAGITGLPEPIQDTDSARKVYVDSVAEGLDIKESVRVCTETNIDLTSSTDPNPVDGVTLSNGDRVLLKSQTDATENGVYVVTTATDPTTWIRSDDADEDSEVNSGLFVFVEEGDTHTSQGFVLSTSDPITVGSTELTFTQFSGAESFTAGDGITQSNNTISHTDTSTQANVTSSSGSAIVDLEFDTFGHVTAATTDSFDGRYVNASGDTMTGDFEVSGAMFIDQSTGDLDIAGTLTENASL